jgi:hypothetical protein
MRANLRPLILLVRDKYLQEQEGITTGTTTDLYNEACRKFPATMKTAHYIWARELYSTLNETSKPTGRGSLRQNETSKPTGRGSLRQREPIVPVKNR